MSVLIAIVTLLILFVWYYEKNKIKLVKSTSLSKGKTLRKIAAQLRQDHPGKSESWVWMKANQAFQAENSKFYILKKWLR